MPKKLAIVYILLLLLAAGCGQVVTKPTATIIASTPTPTFTLPAFTPTPIPTATPVPATPEPTHTPTPEPTPIIHTLQSGDTLIGLARKYGVTVQAIQEANGITDPRGLLVGQQIIIPTDTEARLSAGTPTPEPTPPPIHISPLTFWDSANSLWILGQATSRVQEAVEAVVVQIDLLDADGKIIASAQAPIQQYLLAAGDVAGFALQLSPPPASFSTYYAHVISARPAHVEFYHRDLSIENVQARQTNDILYILSGQVSNAGADSARAIYISAILYDEDGGVIAVRRMPTHPSTLQPGETAFFSLELIPVRRPVADYHLLAEGQRNLSPNE